MNLEHLTDDEYQHEETPDLIEAARALAPRIRALATQAEQERRLPQELVSAITEAGLFRMCMPKTFGGLESDPLTILRVLEEVAAADGSAGWNTLIGVLTNMFSVFLSEDVARDIFQPGVIAASVFRPSGKASPVPGGYQVSGRWAMASGCEHCAWLMANCVILEGEEAKRTPQGQPELRLVVFPQAEAEIIDTWRVAGLRATGSHDFEVKELFVPEARAFRLFADPPQHPGALYKLPLRGFLAVSLAAVATGMARGAIAALLELADAKEAAGQVLLRERVMAKVQLAQAEALLRSARAFLFEVVREAWEAVSAGHDVPPEQEVLMKLGGTHAAQSSAQAIDLMYNLGGASSLYDSTPLQRFFRDIHALTQHAVVGTGTYEAIGASLFEGSSERRW